MKIARFGVFLVIFSAFISFPSLVSAVEYPDVSISPSGVIHSFSVSCTGTNATAILMTLGYSGFTFQSYVGEYMRRPCVDGVVNFDSFDLTQFLVSQAGPWPAWFSYFKPPFQIVVKDTTSLPATDAPLYTELTYIRITPSGLDSTLLSPINTVYPTLAVGSTINYDGVSWTKTPPVVPLPPEPISDPNNLSADISELGDIPRVSINCTVGHDYLFSLIHEENGNVSPKSFANIERKYCLSGVITFSGFNLGEILTTSLAPNWWIYVNTPLRYVIKDSTGKGYCDAYTCSIVDLRNGTDPNSWIQNWSFYSASSTVYATAGKGPVYVVDEDTHSVWANLGQNNPTKDIVVFFPGIMGSRLYEETGSVDCGNTVTGSGCFEHNELWTSVLDSEHAKLALDSQGKSVNEIYTRDDTQNNGEGTETGVINEIFGSNLYQSFISDLRQWKTNGVISDYAFIPYDWRLSLEDIITNGATTTRNKLEYTDSQNFSESYILKKIQELKAEHPNSKITIIGHSNGGLVAKALIQKLEDTSNPLYHEISKVILVAVPQVGTPDAVAAMLHGSSLAMGLLMENQRSRQLMENMPSVYNLIPSAGYFTTVSPVFAADKIVSFENKSLFTPQLTEYGVYVSNETELKNYILGTDDRLKPSYADTKNPNIGNSDLYAKAQTIHNVLDSWQPASTTKVIQIAGWGEETLAGISYVVKRNPGSPDSLSYKIRKVVDGDGTVVVPSALWMSESNPNVERWWVDLRRYDTLSNIGRIHRDIFEVDNVRYFIKSTISENDYTDTENIVVNNISTLVSNKTRLHYTLHSPLTLGVTDTLGRYTGLDPLTLKVREEIPDVTYEQIGEVQFISVPKEIEHTVKLKGLAEGNFSLDIDKQVGNEVVNSTSFQGVPTSVSTIVEMNVLPASEIASSTLEIDNDGNGAVDKVLLATAEGVTIYDVAPPELVMQFSTSTKDVIFSAKDLVDLNPTLTFSSTTITLLDSSGNTTIIPFTKHKELRTRTRLSYSKIVRNGVETNLPNTNIIYDWQEKNGVLSDLDTKVVIKGVEKYVFNYRKANNVTIIKEKKSSGVVTTTKSGFVPVKVETESDSLKFSY